MKVLKPYLLLLTLFIITKGLLMAQCGPQFIYSSNDGRFMVSQVKGCTGLTVEICITEPSCDCVSSCACDFDFGDGDSDTFSHTYTEPGDYRLTIIFPNPTPSDFIDIEITDKEAPDFSLYSCAGNNVKVDIKDTQYDNYQINFGDGTQQTITNGAPDPEHSYANSNPRTVTVKGFDNNALDNCPVATDNFTPISTIPPAVINTLTVINESQLELRYNLSPDIQYRLEIQPNGTGNFSFLKQISPATLIDTVANLNLANTYYCFRVASVDPCNNNTVYSNIICSINLLLDVQDGFNNINWETNTPTSNFSLVRSLVTDNNRTTLDPYQIIGNTIRTYKDNDLQCNTNYCYYIYASFGSGVSISSEQCGVSIRTAATESIDDLSLVVDDNNIILEWPLPNTDVSEYVVMRDNIKIGSSQTTSFTDENVNVQGQSYCYSIEILDQCDNVNSLGVSACSLFLEGAIDKNNVVSLSWNDYSGFQNGVSNYTIEKFYQGTSAGIQNSLVTNYSEVENNSSEQAIGYRVTAVPANSTLPAAVSNLLILAKPNNIYYPTAFTPDGNGNNDIFFVKGQFIVSYSLQIFNRWGQMIFSSDNVENGWDGTINGKPQPEGTYIFNVDFTDLAGREFKKNGSFLLLRK